MWHKKKLHGLDFFLILILHRHLYVYFFKATMNIGRRIRFWNKRNILDPCHILKLLYALVTRASFVMRTRRCYRLTPLFLPILTIYTLMGVTAENSEIFWSSWMNPTGDVPQYCDVLSNVKACKTQYLAWRDSLRYLTMVWNALKSKICLSFVSNSNI